MEDDEGDIPNLNRGEDKEIASIELLTNLIIGSPRGLASKLGGSGKVTIAIFVSVSLPLAFSNRAL